LNMCKNAAGLGIKVITISDRRAKEHDRTQGLDVIRLRSPFKDGLFARFIQLGLFFVAAVYQLRNNNVVAVWCGHVYLSPIGFVLNRLFGIPYFMMMYGGEERVYLNSRLKALVFKPLVRHAAFLCGCSKYVKEQIDKNWEYQGPVHVVHPGVETDKYYPNESNNHDHDVDRGFVLLTVGTLVKRKGHDKVIEALASLREGIPNIKYLIAGSGPELERLEHLAYQDNGLDSIVEFLGFVDDADMPAYYNLADVFIMPSRMTGDSRGTEGFGIVYLEANACGKPVIGGNSGGIPDAVVDGETGMLVDPDDVEDIARAIRWFYDNPDQARRMGAAGRERALGEFQWSTIAGRFNEIVRSNLEVRPGG
jgi:phosphatidylinositol alpha-1,6-mannosyltransferase